MRAERRADIFQWHRRACRDVGRVAKMAGARRCSRRAPSTYQPACKPGSVGRGMHKTRVNALLLAARDGHSSGTLLAQPLQQPTRTADRRHPIRDFSRAVPIRSCSRWGLPCRFRRRKRGALLPHRFTLAAPSREVAVCFLWHFPWASASACADAFSRRTLSGTACPWSPDFPPAPPFGIGTSGRPAD